MEKRLPLPFFQEVYCRVEIGFQDRSYTNVDAHELAHQWFEIITAKVVSISLVCEGFATSLCISRERNKRRGYFMPNTSNGTANICLKNDSIHFKMKSKFIEFYQKELGLYLLHELRDKIFKKLIKKLPQKICFSKCVGTKHFLMKFMLSNFILMLLVSMVRVQYDFNTVE
jgi:aminopeptidase N